MMAAGHPGLHVIIANGDRISKTNCVRQPVSESEIGLHKSTVLVNRLNLFWGLKWQASTQYVTKHTEGKADILSPAWTRVPRGRKSLDRRCSRNVDWLDIGNNANGGQFVLGQPKNSRNRQTPGRLPTAAEFWSELVIPILDVSDDMPACSAVEALERQEPFINQTLAYQALAMLARLFRQGRISYHGGFINLATGRVSSIPLSKADTIGRPTQLSVLQ